MDKYQNKNNYFIFCCLCKTRNAVATVIKQNANYVFLKQLVGKCLQETVFLSCHTRQGPVKETNYRNIVSLKK